MKFLFAVGIIIELVIICTSRAEEPQEEKSQWHVHFDHYPHKSWDNLHQEEAFPANEHQEEESQWHAHFDPHESRDNKNLHQEEAFSANEPQEEESQWRAHFDPHESRENKNLHLEEAFPANDPQEEESQWHVHFDHYPHESRDNKNLHLKEAFPENEPQAERSQWVPQLHQEPIPNPPRKQEEEGRKRKNLSKNGKLYKAWKQFKDCGMKSKEGKDADKNKENNKDRGKEKLEDKEKDKAKDKELSKYKDKENKKSKGKVRAKRNDKSEAAGTAEGKGSMENNSNGNECQKKLQYLKKVLSEILERPKTLTSKIPMESETATPMTSKIAKQPDENPKSASGNGKSSLMWEKMWEKLIKDTGNDDDEKKKDGNKDKEGKDAEDKDNETEKDEENEVKKKREANKERMKRAVRRGTEKRDDRYHFYKMF